jgi:hypothetical protein
MLPTAPFGRTGHDSTRVIFGAAGLGAASQETADNVLAQVREAGINHIDTAASYGDAEDRLKPWLADHRNEVFLATKTGDREGDAARASLERSLERMGVDHVDLIQLHNLVEPHEWEVAHRPGGAVEALARARDEGLTRYLGVTGHGIRIARMHRLSLEQFPFDSVLLPVNFSLLSDARRRAGDQGDRPPAMGRRPNRPEVQLVRAARRPGRDRSGRAVRAQRPPTLPRLVERLPPPRHGRGGRIRPARPPGRRRAGRGRRSVRHHADLRRRHARTDLNAREFFGVLIALSATPEAQNR